MDEIPALRMDEGWFMDDHSGPQPRRKVMAQVNLNLKNITETGLIADAKKYKTALTGNANFTTTNPTLAAYGVLITNAETKVDANNVAQAAALAATIAKDEAIQALHDGTITLGASVQSTSNGDPAIIATADMAVKAVATPVGVLAQVQNLSLTAGDNPGELDAHWNPVKGRQIYDVWICAGDPTVEANWKHLLTCGPSKVALLGLTSGTRAWVRVRANASAPANNGPFSQPATLIVP
jgi:hypothetical protein